MAAVPGRTPPPAVVRRRRAALLATAAVALLAGLVVGATSGDGGGSGSPAAAPAAQGGAAPQAARARALVDRLPLREQVGQLVVLRFAGTRAPGYVIDRLRTRRVAGAILFRDNVTGPEQVRALTGQLRRAAGELTPLVCVDQEGGEVRILPWAPPAASQSAQAAAGTVQADARAAGRALLGQGVNVSLAPVADVPTVAGSALAGRAFAGEAGSAAAAVRESVRGWRAGGVAPTLKHFPGLGGATVNTDDGPATVNRTDAELAQDVRPFAAGIAAGAPLVMVSSAVYPVLDGEHIAAQSPAIVQDLLRRRLGFRGVAITDSLEAAAVHAVGDVDVASVASVRAGMDVILTTGRGSYIRVFRALLAQARTDPAFRARVRQSAARVLALRATLR